MTAKEFWDKIKRRISEQGKTFVWLCRQAGVSVQIMKNRIYKERIPDVEDTLKLMAVLGTSVEEFFGLESQVFAKSVESSPADPEKIPVFEHFSSCENDKKGSNSDFIVGYVEVPDDLKTKKFREHLAASKIRGDSMERVLFNGDTVIYDDLGFQEDGIYAIIFEEKACVKRLQKVSGGVKIISDNPAYEAIFVKNDKEELKIIGKVHYALHKV